MCISIQTRSSPPGSGAAWSPGSGAGYPGSGAGYPGSGAGHPGPGASWPPRARCWPPQVRCCMVTRIRCWPPWDGSSFYMRGRSWHLDPHGTFGLQLSVLITRPHQSPQLHTQCVFPTLSYGVCMKLLNICVQTHTLWWQIMWYVGFLSAQGLFLMDHNYP